MQRLCLYVTVGMLICLSFTLFHRFGIVQNMIDQRNHYHDVLDAQYDVEMRAYLKEGVLAQSALQISPQTALGKP